MTMLLGSLLDDGYGRSWDYRIVSRRDTDPDAPPGQRYLALHQVWYATGMFRRKGQDPGDVVIIESQQATVNGATVEELLLTLERMQQAINRPALIHAEYPDSGTVCTTYVSADHHLADLWVNPKPGNPPGDPFEVGPRVEVQLEPHRAYVLDCDLCGEAARAAAGGRRRPGAAAGNWRYLETSIKSIGWGVV